MRDLRAARKRAGFSTARALVEPTGLSEALVSAMERRTQACGLESALHYCRAIGGRATPADFRLTKQGRRALVALDDLYRPRRRSA